MQDIFDFDVMNELKLMKVNKSGYICYQEEEMRHLLFLVEGRAKVERSLANGKTMLLSFYEGFGVIGDIELVHDGLVNCTVQALTTCYVLALPVEKARLYLQKDVKLLNYLCKALANKLESISNNSSVNLLYPLENRLASYINMVADEPEKVGEKRFFIENLTHLAELLGTSYRHLLRTLNSLCQMNIIHKERKGYVIIDENELEKLAKAIYK